MISFMVMCIVAALFGMVFTIFSSIGLGHNSSRYSYYSQSRSAPTAAAGFYGFQVSTNNLHSPERATNKTFKAILFT